MIPPLGVFAWTGAAESPSILISSSHPAPRTGPATSSFCACSHTTISINGRVSPVYRNKSTANQAGPLRIDLVLPKLLDLPVITRMSAWPGTREKGFYSVLSPHPLVFYKGSLAVFFECHPQLILTVHYNGTVPGDRFAQRSARYQKKPKRLVPGAD